MKNKIGDKQAQRLLQDIVDKIKTVDDYGKWTEKVWITNPAQTKLEDRDITIMSLGLPEEAGEVAGVLKKWIRDGGDLDVGKLEKELSDVAYYWARICMAFGLKPSDVLKTSVMKVEGRILRGTLGGSGDDR